MEDKDEVCLTQRRKDAKDEEERRSVDAIESILRGL